MSVPDALSPTADRLDPLMPPPRPPWLDGREPVMAETLAVVRSETVRVPEPGTPRVREVA
jgi:hypothetical protein